ncbi:MAG: hypothetical protein OEZ01_17785, partial [Candidatus Heimdallarchaeota archaeon]|nr:hypothetical protein [Candidatus Heimdallarchaeota archaeon]
MSKEDEKSFFGMTLNTFRVSHVTGLEKHINALLVDHKGFFRGHIDSYSEKIEKDNKEYNRILKFTGDTEWSSSLFQYAIYINVLNQWTFELLPSGELNGLEFSNIMIERMNELERIYSSVPDNPIIY